MKKDDTTATSNDMVDIEKLKRITLRAKAIETQVYLVFVTKLEMPLKVKPKP